jgi:CubicO group peptidase (beta-lactamase class C family)
MRTFLLFSVFLSVFTTSIISQGLYFPPNNGTWETMDPADLNWCKGKLDSLNEFLADNNTKGFIVLKGGKIVLEEYFDNFTQDSFWYWASAGKSLAGFLVGLAQEQGHIDIDDPVSDYLGSGWTNTTSEQEAAIKIWHQLTLTTGLDERGVDQNCVRPECLRHRTEPGSRWYYYNATYRLVQDVVAAASGMTFQQFTGSQLRNSVGITGIWLNYIFFSQPRSMARFGLLMLAEGEWDGVTIMNDKEYFADMINTSQPHNEAYGYLWWLNGKSSFQLPGTTATFPGPIIPTAPADMYAALGANDQKIYVVPSERLVVIRVGNAASPDPILSLSSFDGQLWEILSDLECTTSSKDRPKRNKPVISPNPVGDQLMVKRLRPGIKCSIVDSRGKMAQHFVVDGNPIDVSGLPQGMYFLLIEADEHTERTVLKFIR